MKQIDVRFNYEELGFIKEMIGNELQKYKCDPFEFSTSVYGIVGVCTNKSSYAFTNKINVMDYYGAKEDVAIFGIEKRPESKIQSLISGNKMINMPVNKIIKEIDIVNEHQQLFENNQQVYDVWLTRGVIIRLEDNGEISLEKNVWFSEMITVNKGMDLLNKFTSINDFSEDWEEPFRGLCSREIVKVNA